MISNKYIYETIGTASEESFIVWYDEDDDIVPINKNETDQQFQKTLNIAIQSGLVFLKKLFCIEFCYSSTSKKKCTK